jgi:hypothetical protein
MAFRFHHQTAANAPGEARPQPAPDLLPPGQAWRGWVWIAVLVVVVVAFIWTGLTRSTQ